MLGSLVRLPPPPTDVDIPVGDIFSSALGLIFTDDLCNQHGDPGSSVIYKSRNYGDIELRLTDPAGEDRRKLFSQYLWNAGVQMAEYLGEERGRWSVEGQKVLELGAGGYGSCWHSPEILANIDINVNKNVPEPYRSRTSVKGHEWGVLTDDFSTTYANSFTRIIAADCLWMPYEHHTLAQSMFHFLSRDEEARVWVMAGFHTGRAKLAPFFDVVEEEGLEIESIWERDVDGNEREWKAERDGGKEDVTGRKRWLVIAVLKSQRLHMTLSGASI
ncbi:S-adenosyl-L-methionine-dependent methyltransferase-like [Lasallia pustulata]|uniref:S-adenosyl-L-methionine-dependent methyltransferase-like n=1 Tax=Lasallia pustulata TaxID=136370 RepID=A0A1W5CXX0_9LECA|nr:S-adenosyl-L-methionine-dependent methyltransferase-like [Lasallia pustulata]